MLDALAPAPTITDLLTVLGSGGTVLGGVIGWLLEAPSWRRAFDNLATLHWVPPQEAFAAV